MKGGLFAALLVLLVIVVYLPSLSAEFVRLDDFQYVIDNPLVHSPSVGHAWQFISEVSNPSTVDGYYQPLTMISLMVDAWWSGADGDRVDPFAFHLTNVLLHAATSVLVFLCIRYVGGGVIPSLLAAGIFALHPAQVESVAWISQRKTVLATPLAIGSVLSYLKYGRTLRWKWLWTSLGLYVLANLAKPTIVFLPLVLPLLDIWPLKRPLSKSLHEKWPFGLLMLAIAGVALYSQASIETGVGLPRLTEAGLLARWTGLICYNFMMYLGNLLWPIYLSPYRAMPASMSLLNPRIMASILACAVILVLWVRSTTRRPMWFMALGAFVLTLGPALGPVRYTGSCVSDRFLYFPFFFPLLALGYALTDINHRSRAFAAASWVAILMILVVLVPMNRRQQAFWKDSKSLWTRVAALVPDLPQARRMLAAFALDEGDAPTAIHHAEIARKLDPHDADHLHMLARAYVRSGRAFEALPLIEEALQIGLGPTTPAGNVALAEARICAGDDAGAQVAADEAIRLGFTPTKCYAEIANIAMRHAKRYEAAVTYYRKAVELDPDNVVTRWNLGTALEYAGKDAEALLEYERVRRMYRKKGLEFPTELKKVMDALRDRMSAKLIDMVVP